MDDRSSGLLGIAGLAGALALFAVVRFLFPSIAKFMLVVVGIGAGLLVLLVAVVLYFAFRKPDEKEANGTSGDVTAILNQGRSDLMELRRMSMQVRHAEIRKRSEDICTSVDKILRTVTEQPEDMPRARQFVNYYLPTLGKILRKYVRIEAGGVPAEDMTGSTIACLGDIRTALEKQYANLFEDDMLDLSVEMEALKLICKRDGLLEDDSAF